MKANVITSLLELSSALKLLVSMETPTLSSIFQFMLGRAPVLNEKVDLARLEH